MKREVTHSPRITVYQALGLDTSLLLLIMGKWQLHISNSSINVIPDLQRILNIAKELKGALQFLVVKLDLII